MAKSRKSPNELAGVPIAGTEGVPALTPKLAPNELEGLRPAGAAETLGLADHEDGELLTRYRTLVFAQTRGLPEQVALTALVLFAGRCAWRVRPLAAEGLPGSLAELDAVQGAVKRLLEVTFELCKKGEAAPDATLIAELTERERLLKKTRDSIREARDKPAREALRVMLGVASALRGWRSASAREVQDAAAHAAVDAVAAVILAEATRQPWRGVDTDPEVPPPGVSRKQPSLGNCPAAALLDALQRLDLERLATLAPATRLLPGADGPFGEVWAFPPEWFVTTEARFPLSLPSPLTAGREGSSVGGMPGTDAQVKQPHPAAHPEMSEAVLPARDSDALFEEPGGLAGSLAQVKTALRGLNTLGGDGKSSPAVHLAEARECLQTIKEAIARAAAPLLRRIREEGIGTEQEGFLALEVEAIRTEWGVQRDPGEPLRALLVELKSLAGRELGSYDANEQTVARIRKAVKDGSLRLLYEGQPVSIRCIRPPGSRQGSIQVRLSGEKRETLYTGTAWPCLTARPAD